NSRDILCPSLSSGTSGFRPEGDQAVNKVLTNHAKDGTKYIVDTLIYPVMNLGGELIEYLYVMHDITEISQLNEEIATTQKEVLFTMGSIGESRSEETAMHVRRVAEYAYHLAKLSGVSEEEANLIKDASPMHDIGKVAIPDSILKKPGTLTQKEYELMKSHAVLGYELLKHSSRPLLRMSAELAHTHHEKWDGTGYPRGLQGEAIPISGRILALADAFDALGHDRVYKKAWPLEEIFDYFKRERGKHFDPMLVDLFFENLDDFLHIYETMQE
ncbi:MAG: HD domain-containing protein, partial [Campylobacterales bacterium]